MRIGLGIGPGIVTVPAASESVWTPASDASTLAWYRADLGVTTGATFTWADQINDDANKNATQSTASAQPTVNASDANLNGQASLTFAGGDGVKTGNWTSAPSQPLTYYIVARWGTGALARYVIDANTGTNRNWLAATTTGSLSFACPTQVNSAFDADSVAVVVCIVANGASSALYANAITTAVASGNAGTAAPAGFTFGSNNTLGNSMVGEVAEIAICSGAHDATKRGTFMNYMAERYAITVAA